MIQVSIKKQNIVTNQASFETQELADAWLAQEVANKSFGKNDRWVHEKELSEEEKIESSVQRKVVVRESVIGKDPVIDEETGEILEERVEAVEELYYQEYFLPKKYEVVIEDKTAEFEAEKTKREQKEQKKEKAKDDLKKIDWSKVTKIADIVPILKAIYDKIED